MVLLPAEGSMEEYLKPNFQSGFTLAASEKLSA